MHLPVLGAIATDRAPTWAAGDPSDGITPAEMQEFCGACRNGRQFCRFMDIVTDCELVGNHYECRDHWHVYFKGFVPCGD